MTTEVKNGIPLPGLVAKKSIDHLEKKAASKGQMQGLKITHVVYAAFLALTIATTTALAASIAVCVIMPSIAAGVAVAVSTTALALLVGMAAVSLLRRVDCLPSPIKRIIAAIHANVHEVFALIGLGVQLPLAKVNFEPKDKQADQTPILLVHGFKHDNSGWFYLRKRLKAAGHGPIYTVTLSKDSSTTIEEHAQTVAKRAEEIRKATGRNDLILIGHSMGGLVSSHYATQENTATHVKNVITLGSPLQGTKMARFGMGKTAKQMRYGSQKELNERVGKCTQTNFFSIRSQSDWKIVPSSAAQFDAQGDHIRSKVIPHLSHNGYYFSDEVADSINDYLSQ